ncbi:PREDICTED: E3 ubiquitin-protein ligase makorin isoform X3 [Camelina sativa]|uniref:E3 ubiquitin-protein ligase makorin isoform X3 n=1 Tax=Camelina sativa TaxID=90675 RepID=A0ABM0T2L9_CAMSA|nr:PREDICTED: E3 ubiquitin-protein ligase makorin isoform X3 [Camelina sativa]
MVCGGSALFFLSAQSPYVLRQFFVHGSCLKGENCEFYHDSKDPPNNVCTFYQKGICFYGSRCRYDHVTVQVFYVGK